MDVVGLLQIALQQNRVFQYGEDSYSVMGITFCPKMDYPKIRKRVWAVRTVKLWDRFAQREYGIFVAELF